MERNIAVQIATAAPAIAKKLKMGYDIIMAVPRHSHTRSKVGKSRMHKYIKPVVLTLCTKCKKPVLPHTVCRNCGYYKGMEVLNILAKLTKKEKKLKEKEIKSAEKSENKE